MSKIRLFTLLAFLIGSPLLLFSQDDLIHQWSVGVRSDNKDRVQDIARSSDGYIYVTGRFKDTIEMDPGVGSDTLISSGRKDIFLAKYDSLGNLVWANKIGGNDHDESTELVLDKDNNIYMTGAFRNNCEFNPGAGQAELISDGGYDVFLAKYTPSGDYTWAVRMGNGDWNYATSIAKNPAGNSVIIGGHYQKDIDMDPDPVTTSILKNPTGWNSDIFVAEYSMSNADHIASHRTRAKNTTYADRLRDISTDSKGNIYITGESNDTMNITLLESDTTYVSTNEESGDKNNIFIAKYDSNRVLKWGYMLGNNNENEEGRGVEVDNSGNVYLTGHFKNIIDLNPSVDSNKIASDGDNDIFLAKYDNQGNYKRGFSIGSSKNDKPTDMKLDGNGNFFLIGHYGDGWGGTIDLDPDPFATDNYTRVDDNDVFVAKYTLSTDYVSGFSIGSVDNDYPYTIEVDSTGSIWLGGRNHDTIDMNPSASDTALLPANNNYNGFIAQYCAPPSISIDSSAFADTVCIYSSSFTLSGGTPSGGQFSGPGVSGGKFFPSSAGVGTHQITYTYISANGCSNSISVPITVHAKPSKPSIDRVDIDTIMSDVSGDHYYWSNNDSALNIDSQKIEVTQAGNYTVMVEKNGCISDTSDSFCFIPLELVDKNDASCGGNDGSATVEVVGGISGNYTYQWSNGDTTPKADSLEAGTYILRVEDTVNGCENSITVNISDIGAPVISSSVMDVECYGMSNGEISIGVSGDAPPYTVQWSTGDTTTVISDLSAGPYEVVVTDQNGCQTYKTIEVEEPDSLNLTTSTVPTGCGNSNGSATVEIDGGTTPYKVDWLGIGSSSDPLTMTGLASGVYTVEVKDTNGCVTSENAVVGETNAPEITVENIQLAACDGNGGGIDISVSGGLSPYSYSWSTGADTQDISSVSAGDYYVSVSGDNGCTAHLDTTIGIQPPPMKEICLITVDENTHKNTIVWENDTNKAVDYVNIYRESSQSNVYFKVGSVDADSISYFVDSVADPRVHSWRYKLSTVDTCGNESKLSDYHETIHLTSNVGVNNTVNLIWD
ncbi:MAG: hypothetical protein ABEH43_03295, partial [Flavobacteriales bacterium]